MEQLIQTPEQMDDFLARYAQNLTRWNAENPCNPIHINRTPWTSRPLAAILQHDPRPLTPVPAHRRCHGTLADDSEITS